MEGISNRREKILIMGAAGRDFHNFNVCFRDDPSTHVIGFTAAQIPQIEGRIYPPQLSGDLYPQGLPIWPQDDLEQIIKENQVQRCILSYSDLSHQTVMTLVSRVLAKGVDFGLLGWRRTALISKKPVIAICAVRTGSGKSQTTRYVVDRIREAGLKVAVVRHPMPYGDLSKQIVQSFSSLEDLDEAEVSFEEREEYEAEIKRGITLYAGVDYDKVLHRAEEEADLLVWDGGNNDLPFFVPNLWITVADALRPGHEVGYYPGEANFRAADVIVINKANSAQFEAINSIKFNITKLNPNADVIIAASQVTANDPLAIEGKRVLVIDDGPSLTHGGMPYGAGMIAAWKYGASEIVDPRPFAVGSIGELFQKYAHLDRVLPAMGYYPQQVEDLEETINRVLCDSVVIGSPIDLSRLIDMNKPHTNVSYELEDMDGPRLRDVIVKFLDKVKLR